MSSTTVKQRLFLLMAVPLLALLISSGSLVRTAFEGYQSASRTQSVLEVAVAAGVLVHALQVERGMTVGFLQSRGQKFAYTLPNMRGKTDAAQVAFQALAAKLGGNAYGKLGDALGDAGRSLEALKSVRERVDRHELPVAEAVAHYTGTIAGLIKVIAGTGGFSGDVGIAQRSTAYLALVEAKEFAGQERALATAVFAANAVDAPRLHGILERIHKQTAYLDLFRNLTGDAERASLAAALGGSAAGEVERMRALLVERAPTGGFDVDPTQWFASMTAKIDALLATEKVATSNIDAAAGALVERNRFNLYAYTALCVVVFLGVVVYSVRVAGGIGKPLRDEVRVAEHAIAENDFTQDVPEGGPLEVQRAGRAFNQLMARFREILSEMRASSSAVTSAAVSLADSSEKVHESSLAQADATASVAAAVEQASVSVSETSNNAQMAAAEVARAREDTDAAMRVMNEAVGNMRSIAGLIETSTINVTGLSESSQRIGGIVKVIREIADQTNLLALNAAIEAARAGEQGRGFAVVADEVRKLAERTGQATQEIGEVIQLMQQGVDGSVAAMQEANAQAHASLDLVGRSEEALGRIETGSRKVAENVMAISGALQEQDAAIRQVAVSIEEIAQRTEHNSEAVEANNATAHRLDELARELRDAVGRFKA
ncbi:MAG: methyl-accepting chemotaxis protein [Rhodocyclaceae bacterium]|nr:methyl-accepting chemotaxis protein [Rhodocyclaceae bacterium]